MHGLRTKAGLTDPLSAGPRMATGYWPTWPTR